MGGSPGDVGEVTLVKQRRLKRRKGWRMSCDVGEAMWESLILQPLLRFTYVQLFSNPSAALPKSELILQPIRCFTNVIGTSPTSPGQPPMPYDDV